jgi:hypothetical protein
VSARPKISFHGEIAMQLPTRTRFVPLGTSETVLVIQQKRIAVCSTVRFALNLQWVQHIWYPPAALATLGSSETEVAVGEVILYPIIYGRWRQIKPSSSFIVTAFFRSSNYCIAPSPRLRHVRAACYCSADPDISR